MSQNYYDDYIAPFLVFSSFILLYLLTFIKPEIEDLEKHYKDYKEKKDIKNIKIDPYLPFYIPSSPLMSPYYTYITRERGEDKTYVFSTTTS